MFFSHRLFAILSAAGLAVAGLLVSASPAGAQELSIPPGTRGYAATMMIQQYMQRQQHHATPLMPAATLPAYHAPDAPVPSYANGIAVRVDMGGQPQQLIATRNSSSTRTAPTVTLRGPDGRVRTFALQGGMNAVVAPTTIVLHRGESLTLEVSSTQKQ